MLPVMVRRLAKSPALARALKSPVLFTAQMPQLMPQSERVPEACISMRHRATEAPCGCSRRPVAGLTHSKRNAAEAPAVGLLLPRKGARLASYGGQPVHGDLQIVRRGGDGLQGQVN